MRAWPGAIGPAQLSGYGRRAPIPRGGGPGWRGSGAYWQMKAVTDATCSDQSDPVFGRCLGSTGGHPELLQLGVG